MRFTKMHGLGNDYVYLDAWQEDLTGIDCAALARTISDRHRGVGSDGLIVVGPSTCADARMTMYNADGSQAEMCGNGLRCAARLAYEHGHLPGPEVAFETGAGILGVTCTLDSQGTCTGARVAMGPPRLTPGEVPVDCPGPGPVLHLTIALDGIGAFDLIAVGMGNPHAVCVVDDAETAPVHEAGPQLECHPRFPNRTNVEFIHRLDDEDGMPVIRQRTWERGSGETEACGTGACAAAVAAILSRLVPPGTVRVRLNGGDLQITWPGQGSVAMEGAATRAFSGDWPLPSPA